MSLIVCNEWFVNNDKSLTFYDGARHKDFYVNKSKSVVPVWASVASSRTEAKSITMYEHHVPLANIKFRVYPSAQFEGYQIDFTKYHSYILALSKQRRVRNGKEFVQSEAEVEVIFGLREPEPVPEPVAEETTEAVTETTQTEVTELTEVVSS
jgi:hypothetical protein